MEELYRDRQAAAGMIDSAGAEREKLIAGGHHYAAIKQLEQRIDEAEFNIAQIDRAAPELQRRLSELRFRETNERWLVVRDAAVEAAETVLPAIREYERALAVWRGHYDQAAAEFPAAVDILPRMPGLFHGKATFADQIERFRVLEIVRGQPAPPTHVSLADAVEFVQRFGAMPPAYLGEWERELRSALTGRAEIEALCPITDTEGVLRKSGERFKLNYEQARQHVAAGRARYAAEGSLAHAAH